MLQFIPGLYFVWQLYFGINLVHSQKLLFFESLLLHFLNFKPKNSNVFSLNYGCHFLPLKIVLAA